MNAGSRFEAGHLRGVGLAIAIFVLSNRPLGSFRSLTSNCACLILMLHTHYRSTLYSVPAMYVGI